MVNVVDTEINSIVVSRFHNHDNPDMVEAQAQCIRRNTPRLCKKVVNNGYCFDICLCYYFDFYT